jgi:putative transposase
MSSVHLYIHIVFGVKRRHPSLEPAKRGLLFAHIVSHAKANHIEVLQINGHDDHAHVLIKLSATQSLSSIMQSIKGESSWWANKQGLFENKLVWACGYYARSIDPGNVWIIKKYIDGQGKHDQSLSYVTSYIQTLKNEK